MDGFEFNKLAGAALSALLLMFGSSTIIGLATGHKLEKPGYTLPVSVAQPGGGGGAAAPAFDPAQVVAQLSKASVENGQASFKKCMTCHTPDKGGRNGTGPNLYGVIGRKIGSGQGFNYSDALKNKGEEWTFAHLASYLHDPKGYIPGNKMAFVGIRDNGELADVMAYLRTLSDSPAPLPN